MEIWLKILLSFLAAFFIDVIWVKYINAVNHELASKAAFWAVLMYGCSGIITINYISQPILLIPTLCGAWLGTYMEVKKIFK